MLSRVYNENWSNLTFQIIKPEPKTNDSDSVNDLLTNQEFSLHRQRMPAHRYTNCHFIQEHWEGEWMNGWMNEWMNEWMRLAVSHSPAQLTKHSLHIQTECITQSKTKEKLFQIIWIIWKFSSTKSMNHKNLSKYGRVCSALSATLRTF